MIDPFARIKASEELRALGTTPEKYKRMMTVTEIECRLSWADAAIWYWLKECADLINNMGLRQLESSFIHRRPAEISKLHHIRGNLT